MSQQNINGSPTCFVQCSPQAGHVSVMILLNTLTGWRLVAVGV